MKSDYPKKILMTTDTLGGVWTYSLDLCRELSAYGISVALASMGEYPSEVQRKEANEISGLKLFESKFKLEWMENPWVEVEASFEWLRQIKNEFQPDLIHLNTFSHGAFDWNIPVIMVGHSDVLSWWQAVKNESAPIQWNEYRIRVSEGLHAADAVVAPTNAMMNELEKFYGTFLNKRIIYNGRNPERFKNLFKEEKVISIGRTWDEAKNISSLIDASEEIKWPIYVAGEDYHPANGNKLNFNGINFLGKLSSQEVTNKLGEASIYCLPAKYEPFGLSALEAAFSGCALVLSNIISLREVWQDSALFVNPNKPDEISSVINQLINDKDLREEYSEKATKQAENFTSEKMAENYLKLYSQVIYPKKQSESKTEVFL